MKFVSFLCDQAEVSGVSAPFPSRTVPWRKALRLTAVGRSTGRMASDTADYGDICKIFTKYLL